MVVTVLSAVLRLLASQMYEKRGCDCFKKTDAAVLRAKGCPAAMGDWVLIGKGLLGAGADGGK